MRKGVLGVFRFALAAVLLFAGLSQVAFPGDWLKLDGHEGPGENRHIVLISGDEEYRSEQGLPQIAKILSQRHGFKCTVLFAIDPRTGIVNPTVRDNIPGLKHLESADLMVIFLRWRRLPESQMQFIDRYLKKGKPVIGMRTSTHAFAPPDSIHSRLRAWKKSKNPIAPEAVDSSPPWLEENDWGPFGYYSDGYVGDKLEWRGGFGKVVLGEKWVAHHGEHQHESTRGIVAPEAVNHPILRGIGNGDIWGSSNVYRLRLPLTGDSKTLLFGQVTKRNGKFDELDRFHGMRPKDNIPAEGKNDPMMPVAWLKSYQIPEGKVGLAMMTTMGAATDLLAEGSRRLLVNSVYWLLGMQKQIPKEGADVDIIGSFKPDKIKFYSEDYWERKQLKPDDFL